MRGMNMTNKDSEKSTTKSQERLRILGNGLVQLENGTILNHGIPVIYQDEKPPKYECGESDSNE